MPKHALYYPTWVISNPVFLAESLLYWDQLACIVPLSEFKQEPWHPDREMRRAMVEAHEKYVFRLVPDDEQKKRVHERIAAIAEHPAPVWCRPGNLRPERHQYISASKFDPETVELLENGGWATPVGETDRTDLQVVAESAANILISVLAEECSSPTMPPLTDDPGSFVASCNSLLAEMGSLEGLTLESGHDRTDVTKRQNEVTFLLVRIPHLAIDDKRLDARVLRNVLKVRENSELDDLRRAFQDKVDEYLKLLGDAKGGERDLIGLEFENQFTSDLSVMKRELQGLGLETLLAKESIVAILLGLAVGLHNPSLGIAIGLASELPIYRRKRKEVLEKHWSSWAFSAPASRFSIW